MNTTDPTTEQSNIDELEVNENIADQAQDPATAKIESDESCSTNEPNNSSGYNSNENPSHVSNENIDLLTHSFNYTDLKQPIRSDYPELNLDKDSSWRNSSGSFSNFIPGKFYPRNQKSRPPEIMAENEHATHLYTQINPAGHQISYHINHNRQSSCMQNTARSQYTYHPGISHHKDSPICSKKSWKSTFISLIIMAVLLLCIVIALGLWKYVKPVESTTNHQISQPDGGVVKIDPKSLCSDTFDRGPSFDLRNEMLIGEERFHELLAGNTYPIIFSLQSDETVSIAFALDSNCRMALIGRREGIPKISNHHFLDTIVGPFLLQDGKMTANINRHLNPGRWYLLLINDNPSTCPFSMKINILNSLCPNSCFGNGHCKDGKCSCFSGWSGDDCSIGSCQNVCSGNGYWEEPNMFYGGSCKCYSGWKGDWCNIKSTECPSCENGDCIDGNCVCKEGYTGSACNLIQCPSNCSENGICTNGVCRCYQGFKGDNCSESIWDTCNYNGLLLNQTCHCYEGYQGDYCDIPIPKPLKSQNCQTRCQNDGSCYQSGNGDWKCQCTSGFIGYDCSIKNELECTDGLDNDQDGLTDCLDPSCCSHPACKNSKYCYFTVAVKHPVKSESFQSKIRSTLGNLQKPGEKNINFLHPVSFVHGEVIDRYGVPVQGVVVTSSFGVMSARPDGSYQMVMPRDNCEKLTFIRDGFRLHVEMVCPTLDYHPVLPITMRLVWDESQPRKTPPPVIIHAETQYAPHFTSQLPKNIANYLVDYDLQTPNFVASLMDGSLKMKLLSPYSGTSTIMIKLTNQNASFLLIKVYCQGQMVGSYASVNGVKNEFRFNWNQEDYFAEAKFGQGLCHVMAGVKYTQESNYIWSQTDVKVLARAPDQLTKSAIGKFRFTFDSIFEPSSNLVYHMSPQRVEPIMFNYEKVNHSTIQINNLINYYEFDSYQVIITENGIFKVKNGKRNPLITNVIIRGESVFKDYVFYTTDDGLHKVDHLRGFQSIVVQDKSLSGPLTVSRNGDVYVVASQKKLLRLQGKAWHVMTARDPHMFKSQPCFGSFLRLDRVELRQIKSIQYSTRDNSLVLYDFAGLIFKVDLQNEDYWTKLLAGSPVHCVNGDYDSSMIRSLNSIRASPTGKIFASSANQIYEISNDGALVAVFGTCGKNCNMILSNSAAKLNGLVQFSFSKSDVIRIIEHVDENTSNVSDLQPLKPKKTPTGYEIGYPKENLIRVYLSDGRLVKIKDIFTLKTLKYFKYQASTLLSVEDQFKNEIKISHLTGRILLQNSANQRRAQITLGRNNVPVELIDDDSKSFLEFDESDRLISVNDIQYVYDKLLVSKVSSHNQTYKLRVGSNRDADWSVDINRCHTISWSSGDFYFTSHSQNEIRFITADGSKMSYFYDTSLDTLITSLDPISRRPLDYGEIIRRGPDIPVKEISWISISHNKESYIKRMLKDGNTLMSYELDYSADQEVQGRFYDETVNLLGELSFNKNSGRLNTIRVQYQKLHSENNQVEKHFKYYSNGLLKEIQDENGLVTINRSRSGRLNAIVIGTKTWKIKVQKDIDIRTPEGAVYTIAYNLDSTGEINIVYPTGTTFSIVKVAGVTCYSRSGIKFLEIEDDPRYTKITRFEEEQYESTVMLKDCAGNHISDGGLRTFMYDNANLVGVKYQDGFSFKSDYLGGIKTLDSAPNYRVEYHYDSNHRSIDTRINVFGRSASRTWAHDKDELKQIDDFDVVVVGEAVYQITMARSIIYRKYNPRDQTKITKHNLMGQLVINKNSICEFNFNPNIESYQITTGSHVQEIVVKYNYDGQNRILSTSNEQMRYTGHMLRSVTRDDASELLIGRDHFDRVIRFGSTLIKYNHHGITSIGEDVITWNLQDQLTSYNGDMLYYDHENRLIQFGDVRLVYSNSNFKRRLTHVINPEGIRHLYYDLAGSLFSIIDESGDQSTTLSRIQHFVVTQYDGSPKYIFNEQGLLNKQITRSYFGHVISETNAEFELLIGHRGDICIGHLCRDHISNQWRQTLTGDQISFGFERNQLNALSNVEPGLSFDLFDNIKWPFRNVAKFSFLYSKREKLVESFLGTMIPILPQTCNMIYCSILL